MGGMMRKPRFIGIAILMAFTLVVAACGDDDDGGASGETFRIAIVAPSASNDLAFSQSRGDAG
jgi:hypothetical protein